MGNPNAKGKLGNKGGGRKSAYQERAAAKDVETLFFGNINQEELEAKIRSGVFSVKDRYLLTAMEGDTKVLTSLSNKALPDKVELSGDSENPVQIEHGIQSTINKIYRGSSPSGTDGEST